MKDKPTDNLINQLEEVVARIRAARDDMEAGEILREIIDAEKQDAVSRLAAWLAHKINNPLGTISGSAQLLARRLERDVSDPGMLQSYLKYTDGIRSEIERCTRSTSDLMEFTRPKPG